MVIFLDRFLESKEGVMDFFFFFGKGKRKEKKGVRTLSQKCDHSYVLLSAQGEEEKKEKKRS